MESQYFIMDSRANFDVQKATVLETCDTLEEAIEGLKLYDEDSVIIDRGNNIVYPKPHTKSFPAQTN